MKRYNRFKQLNCIRDEFILESMPDYLGIRTKKQGNGNPVIRFLGSGWGAACICAVVALSIMAVILRMGQDPWGSPAGTQEQTDTEVTETQIPTLPSETEAPTEADTTPYFDPESLDIDTYQGMTPDIPYKIVYHSNGDGTCMVTNVIINILYEGDITVEIPETSPDGETVVGVFIKPTYNVPTYISAEEFKKIETAVLEYYDNNRENYYYKQFMSYYQLKGLEFCTSEYLKNDLLSEYPIAAYTNIYVFDYTATEIEYALRSHDLAMITPWYTAEWCYADRLKLKDLAELHGITDPYLDQVLAAHSGSFENVSEIKLPKTLKPRGDDLVISFPSIHLDTLSIMGIDQMIFDGTVAEMTAIADPTLYELAYPLVIHCTDGDIIYPVKE
ncbi:MAG: hypothetical protein E7645_07060 [Ruminococcaceae bacterium]|nr:hypothetical protein [Oscillospiraceae bacterium]